MSRDRGNRAPAWVAEYVRPWWPLAEKTPNSRPGRDIENTPGVAWEIKTSRQLALAAAIRQAAGYAEPGEVPVVCYLPPGIGERSVGTAMCIMPLAVLMPVLAEAGYAPMPRTAREEGA
ncbi:MAG: hypothetical protein FWE35_10905 [Streptosporangiales bacterium]|nr:hypothetical protein [Streptosporangiales bacterium]